MTMPDSDCQGPWPGRFVWHDLMTTDAAASRAFYEKLLGWTVEDRPMGDFTYHMIHAGPGPIGGIIQEPGIPVSHWIPYIAVEDVDAAAARCTELGGEVCIPPRDIPETGRFCMVGDPQGAFFSLYAGNPESSGADPDVAVPGRVCWNEVLTTDDAGAQEFYSAMFGWTDAPMDMGPMGTYHCQMLGDKQAAGLMKHPAEGAPSMWMAYFFVEDLAAATNTAKELGATPIVENNPIPGVGSFSTLTDPVGAVFALFQGSSDPADCEPTA